MVDQEDYVNEDMGRMKVHNWSTMFMDREESKRMVDLAKTHKEF